MKTNKTTAVGDDGYLGCAEGLLDEFGYDDGYHLRKFEQSPQATQAREGSDENNENAECALA